MWWYSITLSVLIYNVQCDPLTEVICEQSEDGYLIPDPFQCDRFAECTPHGKLKIELCEDGYALDLKTGVCDLYNKIDCSGREKLQDATGGGLCPRPTGNFPVPAEVSCSEFVDCREGRAFMQNCGHGAVFDEILGCVHPDETNRVGCTAEDVFGFKCPEFGDSKRFGDHERLPHPEDCAFFYACLYNGKPRLLGCTKPKVFDPESGLCMKQHLVPGCENRYPKTEDDVDIEAERDRIGDEIRAELEAKYGLRKGSLEKESRGQSESNSDRSRGSDRSETRKSEEYERPDPYAGLSKTSSRNSQESSRRSQEPQRFGSIQSRAEPSIPEQVEEYVEEGYSGGRQTSNQQESNSGGRQSTNQQESYSGDRQSSNQEQPRNRARNSLFGRPRY